MSQQVGFAAAFAAGLVSFLSPCVLPLLPVYISFMTGVSVSELQAGDRRAGAILMPVSLFVVGFTLVFVTTGASASVLGQVLVANRDVVSKLAGAMLAVLGFVLIEPFPMPWLHRGGVDAGAFRKFGPWASLVLGLAFPLAMGPCAGPVYGAILTLAVQQGSVSTGALLLLVISAGLAVPFVVTSLLLHRLSAVLRFLMQHSRALNRFAGVVLVLMGLLMVTGLMGPSMSWIESRLPSLAL